MSGHLGVPGQSTDGSSYADPIQALGSHQDSAYPQSTEDYKSPGESEKYSYGDVEHDAYGKPVTLDYTPPTTLDALAGNQKSWGDLTGISPEDRARLFPPETVREGMKQRHIQMIALCGAIGTGLFLGMGKSLAHAGPVLLLLGYLGVGTLVFAVMWSLGPVATLAPVTGAWIRHADMFADEALSFTAGMNILYGHAISAPTELVAAAVLVQYWNDSISPAVFVTIFGAAIVVSNTLLMRIYGETEFVMACLKLMLILGLIIFGICIDLGAGPNGKMLGFHYWKHGMAFGAHYIRTGGAGRWYGFWSVLTGGVYSFSGVETIAIAAAETKNARKAIPQATRRIFARIIICYMLTIFVCTLIVPWNDKRLISHGGTSSASPFVVAAERAGVKVLPHIINAVVLTSAWSAGNSAILATSRTALTMAQMGWLPKFVTKTHRYGVPWVAVTFALLWLALAYTCVSKSATQVFGWFSAVVSSCALWGWGVICINGLCLHYARKAQGIQLSELPWGARGQPYVGWFGLVMCLLVLITGGFPIFIKGNFSAQTMVSAYCSPVINSILFVGYKLIKRTKWVKSTEAPIRPWIIQANNNPLPPRKPRTLFKRIATILWS